MSELLINGIVSARDKRPYVQISTEEGMVAQLSMAQARNVAIDMLQMCARTEADAMLRKFFDRNDFPQSACDAMLIDFRDFRAQLDDEQIERSRSDPDTGEKL
jgi:hypothetical protein